MLDVTLKWRHW